MPWTEFLDMTFFEVMQCAKSINEKEKRYIKNNTEPLMNMIVMTIRGIMGGKHDWIYLTESKPSNNIEKKINDEDMELLKRMNEILLRPN